MVWTLVPVGPVLALHMISLPLIEASADFKDSGRGPKVLSDKKPDPLKIFLVFAG